MYTSRKTVHKGPLRAVALLGATLCVLIAGGTSSAIAQDVSTLMAQLDSQDWQERGTAVARIRMVPVAEWPPELAERAIELLEYEVTHTDGDYEGEGYGEYLMHLSRLVLELRDPNSLRGLALYGIDVSRDFRHFIAAHGATSMPYLDEAWALGARRSGVAATWGYMLGTYGDRLSQLERQGVLARLLTALHKAPFTFDDAASESREPMLVPALEAMAAEAFTPYSKLGAEEAAAELISRREQASVAELYGRFSDLRAAICIEATDARDGVCRSLDDQLTAAAGVMGHEPPESARSDLRAFIEAVEQAYQDGLFTDMEHRLLVENAEYLISRL